MYLVMAVSGSSSNAFCAFVVIVRLHSHAHYTLLSGDDSFTNLNTFYVPRPPLRWLHPGSRSIHPDSWQMPLSSAEAFGIRSLSARMLASSKL